MMNYKGYIGYVEFDDEAKIFHGEIINTRDVITFQGRSVKELEHAFVDSIEDYLQFCVERGEEPERPFSGKLTIRLNPKLHREAYIAARHERVSLNHWFNEAIAHAVRH